jgi:nucleotide-binding universal stress UspA family protein
MKILFAADGSPFTKKALAFLVTHEGLLGPDGELVVLNVQPTMPPEVRSMVGTRVVQDYEHDEALKILEPIKTFLGKHPLKYRAMWTVGAAGEEIVRVAAEEQAHLIVMGTHGYGAVARLLLGSVATHVVAQAAVPVLLVK